MWQSCCFTSFLLQFHVFSKVLYIAFIHTMLHHSGMLEFLPRLLDAVLNDKRLVTILREKSALELQFFLNHLVVVGLFLFTSLPLVGLQLFFVWTQVEIDDIFFWLFVSFLRAGCVLGIFSSFNVYLISERTDSFFSSKSSRRLASVFSNVCFISFSSSIVLVVRAFTGKALQKGIKFPVQVLGVVSLKFEKKFKVVKDGHWLALHERCACTGILLFCKIKRSQCVAKKMALYIHKASIILCSETLNKTVTLTL